MTSINIATRQEWLAARKELLAREKEHTRLKDEITKARQAMPWVKVEKDYVFAAKDGPTHLSELFGPHSQLIVYHFMFGREWENPCKSCSLWADSFSRLTPHLNARDIGFVAVSSAPLERLLPFKGRLGWKFNWVSSHDNDFNYDFDVGFGPDRPNDMPRSYNFGTMEDAPIDEMHGTSVFAKDEEGTIYHTYSMYGRGLDATNAAYAYMDLTPKGRSENPNGNPMSWLQYNDSY